MLPFPVVVAGGTSPAFPRVSPSGASPEACCPSIAHGKVLHQVLVRLPHVVGIAMGGAKEVDVGCDVGEVPHEAVQVECDRVGPMAGRCCVCGRLLAGVVEDHPEVAL